MPPDPAQTVWTHYCLPGDRVDPPDGVGRAAAGAQVGAGGQSCLVAALQANNHLGKEVFYVIKCQNSDVCKQ